MQKRNQIIKWGALVVLVLAMVVYGSIYYSSKPKIEPQEEVKPKERNTQKGNPIFKIDTVKQQKRIKQRAERRQLQDSLDNLQDIIN